MKIRKSRYEIFLQEYTRKFELMNLRHQKATSGIGQRVEEIIRLHIRSGWLSLKDVNRQHSLLFASISESMKIKHQKDIDSFKIWESNRLQQLFPEVNNEVV